MRNIIWETIDRLLDANMRFTDIVGIVGFFLVIGSLGFLFGDFACLPVNP